MLDYFFSVTIFIEGCTSRKTRYAPGRFMSVQQEVKVTMLKTPQRVSVLILMCISRYMSQILVLCDWLRLKRLYMCLFFFSPQACSLSDDPTSLSHLLALQPATATVAAACLCQAVLYAIVSRYCKHLTCICWLFFHFLPVFFQVQMFCTMEQ